MSEPLARDSGPGRLTLATVILGSGVATLDGTVVNIAVKAIGTSLGASLTELQWVLNGYMLSLASLILVGGSLGDRLGRRRVYLWGVTGFAVMSAVCAVAQSPGQLVVARVLQGVAAALLTPGSLAIIESTFRQADRAWAIGTWAGVSGIAAAVGPFVGGLLIAHLGWRWIFLINLPLCALVVVLGLRIPETRDEEATGRFDVAGAVLGVLALGATTYALTGLRTLSTPVLVASLLVALAAGVGFVVLERRPGAMAPVTLFASRVFSAANLMTFLVYGALGAVVFFLVLQLQVTTGYTPLAAGVATLPITIALVLLSSRFAELAQRIGPRIPMSVGPVVCAAGVLLLVGVDTGTSYWTGIFPGMVVFSLGLAGLVSPLTAAVLAAAPRRHAGVASGINNAVARAGSLLAVAALPAVVGLTGKEYGDPALLTSAYQDALIICAVLLTAGGVVSWFGLRDVMMDANDSPESAGTP